MSLKPIRDFIVVSVVKAEEKTASGLYVPTTIDEKIVTAKVLAVGSGYLTDNGSIVPLEVKVGDSVMFNKQMSVEVKNDGQTFHLLREEHVLSVLN